MMATRHHSADAVGELASSQFLPFFSPAKRLTTKEKTPCGDGDKTATVKQRVVANLSGRALVARSCY